MSHADQCVARRSTATSARAARSARLATLQADYTAAKTGGNVEQQIDISTKIQNLQMTKRVQCNFRLQQIADVDAVLARLVQAKAREKEILDKAKAAAEAEE